MPDPKTADGGGTKTTEVAKFTKRLSIFFVVFVTFVIFLAALVGRFGIH